jgi:hypothetical protein
MQKAHWLTSSFFVAQLSSSLWEQVRSNITNLSILYGIRSKLLGSPPVFDMEVGVTWRKNLIC